MARQIAQQNPRFLTTYYALDTINFRPADTSSATDVLDAPYLPLVVLEAAGVPLVLTSGRLTEYEGGGDETRSNPWLAELQQNMFVEINPVDANNNKIKDGQMVWVEGTEGAKIKVMAMVTRRVAAGTVWSPFHFGGWYQGEDLRSKYPPGADPFVLGEAVNTATAYGYDIVTLMQETKTMLCRVRPA